MIPINFLFKNFMLQTIQKHLIPLLLLLSEKGSFLFFVFRLKEREIAGLLKIKSIKIQNFITFKDLILCRDALRGAMNATLKIILQESLVML